MNITKILEFIMEIIFELICVSLMFLIFLPIMSYMISSDILSIKK